MTDYVLDNAWQHERERLDVLTMPYDNDSRHCCVGALGTTPGH
jgi:hypothetical protein